jgi:hypothetical protein
VACGPVATGRTCFDVADIVRQHRDELEARYQLSTSQRRVLSAIALCRTSALGGHLELCPSCGYEHPAYNSCRNRHCPKCQALAQEKWIAARSERMLPVGHFHVVFTLPAQLRPLASYQPKLIYDALFQAASLTLLELGRSRLEAQLGATMVLHTWTRALQLHPHLHAIVTAGGLSSDGSRWVPSARKFLFPLQAMSAVFRAKMLGALASLRELGSFDGFDDFRDPEAFDRLMGSLSRTSWVVYAKMPFAGVDQVLRYLGRYTHRVAIANSRLVDLNDSAVTFRTKNGKTCTLPCVEFLRRFLLHVLPAGFVKIRHYGLLASANVDGRLEVARKLLDPCASPTADTAPRPEATCLDILLSLTGRDARVCPRCGTPLVRTLIPLPNARSPP